jgi:hypothetical protein
VYTDQKALKFLLTAPTCTDRQERFLTDIMRFMPDIRYIKGIDNVVADALSRRAELATLHVSSLVSDTLLEELSKDYENDPQVPVSLDQGTVSWKTGLLYTERDKIYVSEGSVRERILAECHDTPFSGHFGRSQDC